MKKTKTPEILIILYLILVLSVNGALAVVCLCGNSWSYAHVTDNKKKILSSRFHTRCASTACENCNLGNGESTMTAAFHKRFFRMNIFKKTIIYSSFKIEYLTPDVLSKFSSFYQTKITLASPIYLQNLTLLN